MICQICCEHPAEHVHHLFSQSKRNRELYGKLIDHPLNTIPVCSVCHLWKGVPKFTEKEFCDKLGIEPKSKTEKMKHVRGNTKSI